MMRRKRKRILSVLLALVLAVSMLPVTAFAAGQRNTLEWTGSDTWDPKFVAAVNKQLGADREPDAGITQEEMQGLYSLVLDADNMNVNGIQFATGLHVLRIKGHAEGLENLAYCGSLTTLEITYDNVIEDLNDIRLPESLKTLRISNCSSLTSLEGLDTDSVPNLNTIDVSRNDILSDISALKAAELPNLSSADFENCYAITDITPLKNSTSLTDLDLEKVEITEENRQVYRETISSLTHLKVLYLPYCELTDEDTVMFEPLKELDTLVLAMNNLTSTEFCRKLPGTMRTLSLHGNDIQDAGGLSGLTNLEILGLGGNQITDFTFIKNMTELTNGTVRHAEGEEDSPFIETYYYNNGESVEIEADGTVVLENPYVDVDGNVISFQNAKVSISGADESAEPVVISEDGSTLTLSNVMPGYVTVTADYKLPTKASTFNETQYKFGNLRIVVAAVEKKQDSYTVSYDWGTDVPEGQVLPSDTTLYESPDAAKAAIDQNFTNETAVKGEKDGKEGIWTFSGWTVTVDGLEVKAVGSWSFAEHQHDWGAPTYTWSEDGKTCTAERVCTEDSRHVERETVDAAGEVTTPATCTAKGQTTYTAVFTCGWAETQTRVLEDVEKIPHSYGDAWKTDADSHWHACTVCGARMDEAAHSYQWVIDREATDQQNGSRHQECSVCGYALAPVDIPQIPKAEKPQTDSPRLESPRTGDTHNPLLWVAFCASACAGLGVALFGKKKQAES